MPRPITENEYARMLGFQPGQYVSGETRKQIREDLKYYNRKAIDMMMDGRTAPDRPVDVGYITNAPRVTVNTDATGNVITNTNSGPIVHQVEKFADGTFRIIPPSVQNFRSGSAEIVAPGTARTITNEQTGAPELNYSSEYSEGGSGAATIGAYNANPGAPSPVATPTATTVNTTTAPTVAPPPQQVAQSSKLVRVIAPDGRQGSIPAEQVEQAIKQGFRVKAP